MPASTARLTILILLLVSLGACKTWYKPGAEEGDLETAQQHCEQASGARTGADYHACMQQTGWQQLSKGSAEAHTPATQAVTATSTTSTPSGETVTADDSAPALSSWTKTSDDARPLNTAWKLCDDTTHEQKEFQTCMRNSGWRPAKLHLWVEPPGEDN